MMGSYCHCQQVVTFFFFFFGLHLTTWVKGPTLTLCPGPLNFSGRPCRQSMSDSGITITCISHLTLKLIFQNPVT